MPKQRGSRKNANRKQKRQGRKSKKSNSNGNPFISSAGKNPHPTLVLKGHLMINQTVNGVNLKQINVAPTLSNFPTAANQAKFY